ncbi:cysteine dioxygenase, partial [Bacillus cereus]|nr:cysteine dioxygenase [Bacillus cereus]
KFKLYITNEEKNVIICETKYISYNS